MWLVWRRWTIDENKMGKQKLDNKDDEKGGDELINMTWKLLCLHGINCQLIQINK